MASGRGRPRVMGVLNVTPDSFSDGGRWAGVEEAVKAGVALHRAGADVVDVGGESTRPGARPVPEEEELRRVVPVIRGLAQARVPVSVDTMKPAVMRAAVRAGAVMINDVTALGFASDSLATAAALGVPVVLMHMQGTPATMQQAPHYADVVGEVLEFLRRRLAAAEAAGIPRARLIVDPGIGFGKTLDHNLAILRHLERFLELGQPLLVGASRKSLIPAIAGPAAPDARLGGSLALALRAAEAGAAWVRVHDVVETVQALDVWAAVRPAR
ncbi:MAG: dihydropteroate synthase [Sphingomonadaceae bacterium]|uniref:dihydropteroate synthase n=1 Tax=Thermaurantiacus sp. TaxID=2820283 RepID=UPI00298EFC9A|nr:dihydropteroate synthase [Thermaurantiacus sp.]MCS6986807.1 dihydropteroate synthase [Sphingomonadaceae bacterium]MDW8413930.1 dihydropteroate synthase [Thermaurantiacus sp.]